MDLRRQLHPTEPHRIDDRPLSQEARNTLFAMRRGRLRRTQRGWLSHDEGDIIPERAVATLAQKGLCVIFADASQTRFARLSEIGKLVVRGMMEPER